MFGLKEKKNKTSLKGGAHVHKELSKEIERNKIEVLEIPMSENLKGLYVDNVIAINKKIETESEKYCTLAEELGHHHTSYGHILDQSDVRNRKQELRARRWAYKKLVGIIDLVNAYKAGVRNRYELAEYLNVTEEFIEDALKYYNQKYGMFVQIDNYVVYFQPLAILEVWDLEP